MFPVSEDLIKIRHSTIIIGTIVIITAGLLTSGFLALEAIALSFIPTASNSDVILLPFGKSMAPNYHGITPSTTSKWYQGFLRPTTTLDQQVALYKLLLDPTDHIRGVQQNVQLTASLPFFKGIEYGSLADLTQGVPSVRSHGMKFVGLDLEKGLSPAQDTLNVVATTKQASAAAHSAGLLFQLSTNPATVPIRQWGSVARYCDILDPQGQSLIKQSVNTYTNFIGQVSSAAKAANPNVQLLAQMTVDQGIPMQTLQQATLAVAPYVNGFTCWFSDSTFNHLTDYITWFKSRF